MDTFLDEEVLANNLATLQNGMVNGRTSLDDYLKIAMLCKIYKTLEEIKDKINSK